MLNGKFYTGLPPGMIERSNVSAQRNRMQSSIFWPDDTKVDSAVETRVKRRNSLQIAQNEERPPLHTQTSVSGMGDSSDVNTKQLFQKEFSKSSIEFLDNLCADTKPRRPLLLRGNRNSSNEVTPKPTALSPTLPDDGGNAGYNTSAKRKQAFTSKIEFYDYAGDELCNRNNLRAAKMDMNDKKEMERNSKNSPKLQVKNNVRDLSQSRESLYPSQVPKNANTEKSENTKFRNDIGTEQKNNVRNEMEERQDDGDAGREVDDDFEVGHHNSLPSDKMNVRSRGNRLKDDPLDYLESRRTVSPEYGYRREESFRDAYEDDYEIPDYEPTANRRYAAPVRRANSVGRFTSPPKRVLKHYVRERTYRDVEPNDGYRSADTRRVPERYRDGDNDYNDPDADLEYVEDRMRNIRLRTSPRKEVTYSDDTYSPDDEMPNRPRRRPPPLNAQSSRNRATPNMQSGSNQQKREKQELRRCDSELDLMEQVNNEMMEQQQQQQTFMENDIDDNEAPKTTKANNSKQLNIGSYYNNTKNSNKLSGHNNNNNNNKNNTIIASRLNNQTISSAARKITPKITTKQNTDTTPTPAEPTSEAVGAGMRKHLRSSLCLHNGEIVASDDGGDASTAKSAPTRSARSMATRQRISVGLPD